MGAPILPAPINATVLTVIGLPRCTAAYGRIGSNRAVLVERGRALVQQCAQTLFGLWAAEPHEFQSQRAVEDRASLTQPVVQSVLGPAQCRRRACRKSLGDLQRLILQFVLFHTQRN